MQTATNDDTTLPFEKLLQESEQRYKKMAELAELRRAELEETRAFLKSILNSTKYGIAAYKPIRDVDKNIVDFRISFSNSEVPANFDLRPEEVVGKTCREVYPGIFDNGVFEKMVRCMETNRPQQYEVMVDLGPREIWLTASVDKFQDAVTVTSKNITEEKNAALHLQAMNRLLANKNKELEQQILSEFSESFATYRSGNEFFDSLILELARKTQMEFVIVGELIRDENGASINCFSYAESGKISECFNYPIAGSPSEITIKGKMHSHLSGLCNAFPTDSWVVDNKIESYVGYPLTNSKGECIGVLSVLDTKPIKDSGYISWLLKIAAKRCELELERIKNEKELEEKNTELERNNKELKSFNYIASHDLQEPLRKIQLFYSRIIEKDKDNISAASREHFESINKAADRMQNLIQALLTYSTVDYSNMHFEKVDLNKLMSEVIGDLSDMIEMKNATVSFDGLPKVRVAPLQFQQLLLNLISNGIKYSKKGVAPEINIFCELVADEHTKGKKFWKITVADNGIGFEQQYEDKIFELFQRLHGKSEFVGTGIGLAICKRIIQNHEGFIKVESQPGHGSQFHIYLPLRYSASL